MIAVPLITNLKTLSITQLFNNRENKAKVIRDEQIGQFPVHPVSFLPGSAINLPI